MKTVPNNLNIIDLSVRTLANVCLEVNAGQCAGLTGPSGSGKTLLLRAVADMDPHGGQVRLNGLSADQTSPELWRRQVGLLPAESAWWHDIVGPHFETDPQQWLDLLGFDRSVLSWEVRRLSSGERQRLALVRLLEHMPRVMLLDEPTANLDARNIERVEAVIGQYRNHHHPSVLWVSHDLNQLRRNCDQIYAIEDSRLAPVSMTESDTKVEECPLSP
jgi:ABC-type iron transport system FetAB ATPase subunit